MFQPIGLWVLMGLCWPQLALFAMEPAPVEIEIVSPGSDEVVRNRVNVAPVRGRALSGSDAPKDFDVMIAIDVSHSSRFPSGIDVDQDGETGLNPQQELVPAGTYPEDMVCSDPEDTILAAEILASRQLLKVLDPAQTRVGVLVFSGAVDPATGLRLRPDQRDALLKIPLTNDFEAVAGVLDEILEEGPYGATNFSAAIQLGVVELAGLSRAYSEPRPGARKVMLFLTDGVPTFPFGKGTSPDPEDAESAIAAARLAKTAGVTINSFAIGQQALVSPLALNEISSITQGTFTAVRNPGDIVNFLSGVSFANISDVVVTNLTTGDVSFDVELLPDGSFLAFVPVREGDNRVEVAALASDGGEQRLQMDLEFEKSGLTARELAIELERVKKRNQALMRLIEQ
ncbi:VWA domain-containing protein, partial [Myxococcota bacterium]|nr:VWA domain-containing protein [Myxococcota bacterium]